MKGGEEINNFAFSAVSPDARAGSWCVRSRGSESGFPSAPFTFMQTEGLLASGLQLYSSGEE